MAAKPLYIASSVEELIKMGEKDKIPGGALLKEKIDKVSKAARDALISHDEERAYVLYYRVADALVCEMKKNNADKKYLDLLFKDLLLKSTTTLEDLGRSLAKRYEEKQKLLHDPSSAKNTSMTVIANGNPPREDKENVAGDFHEEAKITCKSLLHLVKDSNNRILLVDVRPSTNYEQSFISKLPGNVDTVHVREEWLGSVVDPTSFELCISPEHLTLLKNRKSYSDIIIFDGCSMKLNDNASLNKVFQLLWTFGKTSERSTRPPIILEGGFQEWILTYPTYVSNSNYHPSPRMPSPVKGDRLQDVYRNDLMIDTPEGTVTNGIVTHPVHRTYLPELPKETRKSTPGTAVQVPKPCTVSIVKPSLPPGDSPPSKSSRVPILPPDRSSKPKTVTTTTLKPKNEQPAESVAEAEFKQRKLREVEEEMKKVSLEPSNLVSNNVIQSTTANCNGDSAFHEKEAKPYDINGIVDVEKSSFLATPLTASESATRIRTGDRTLSESKDSFRLSSSLSRSYSSPNIAKLNEIEEGDQPEKPTFDRRQKPSFYKKPVKTILPRHRDFAPIYGTTVQGVTGLRNLGNTCFMNAIIQCLSNTPELVDYFLSGESYQNDINILTKFGSNGELAVELAEMLKQLWSSQFKCISPKDFRSCISTHMPLFTGNEQQDAHEFFTMLMEKLHADLNRAPSISPAAALAPNLETHLAVKKFWENHTLRNSSVISELFEGLLLSTLICRACGTKSDTFETFTCLSLPIPSATRTTLIDCLRLFTEPEVMSGEAMWDCTMCKSKREAVKHIQFCRLPRILVLHLKRFSYEGMWRQKLTTPVEFPLENLDVNQFLYVGQAGQKPHYELYGIVNHSGTIEGGHYVASCKNYKRNRWYKFDDNEVSDLAAGDVRGTQAGTQAYVLFYRMK